MSSLVSRFLLPSANGSQTGIIAAAVYARVAADSPARGAAAPERIRVRIPPAEVSKNNNLKELFFIICHPIFI